MPADHLHHAITSIAVCGALFLLPAATAGAATYPPGGGSFAADAQGWQATGASCSGAVGGACAASGAHDPGAGNPPGSLAATTTVTLNLGGVFESSVVFESPSFTVGESGPAALHLERQFAPGGLVALAPRATYAVSLVDQGSGTPTELIAETVDEDDAAFAGRDAAASLQAGRTYALRIAALGGSTAGGLGVLGASTVRFDNVALRSVGQGGGGAGGGSPGGGAASGGASAGRPGKHVFVKVRCPRRPRRACLITAHGRIGKRARVTYRRTVRVAKGRSKVVALRVKPRFRKRVAGRKRLRVVQRIRIGKRTRTFSRSRALIRRP